MNDAAQATDLLAEAVVQSALEDALLTGDPAAAPARPVVRERVLRARLVRVKLWNAQGAIVYSDEPRLVGPFALGEDERGVLLERRAPGPRSRDLTARRTSSSAAGKLLEVYRPVWTPAGSAAAVREYTPLRPGRRAARRSCGAASPGSRSAACCCSSCCCPAHLALSRGCAAPSASARRCCSGAVDASREERRRIAATLHDGVVQELVGHSFAVAGAAGPGRAPGDAEPGRHAASAAGDRAREHRRPALAARRHLPAEPAHRRAAGGAAPTSRDRPPRDVDVARRRRRADGDLAAGRRQQAAGLPRRPGVPAQRRRACRRPTSHRVARRGDDAATSCWRSATTASASTGRGAHGPRRGPLRPAAARRPRVGRRGACSQVIQRPGRGTTGG